MPPFSGEGCAPWDMEFQGQWEMDRDLISEFIAKQDGDGYGSNQNKKNQVLTNMNFKIESADKYDRLKVHFYSKSYEIIFNK